MKRIYRSIGSITLGWLIGSCGGGGDSIVGPPPPTTASVTISSDTATLVPAATIQFSATAKTASGDALTRTFSWTSSDPAKATVSSSGRVVGVAPGTATITAAVDGKSAAATITVLDGGVVSGAGGTLSVESGAVQIVVPPAALGSTTNLSVTASSTFASDPRVVKGTPFDFGPSGTNFAKPVVLRIAYLPTNLPPGTAEAALEIYFHDPSTGWQVVPGSTVDLNAKVVSAEISHFSTYAILIPEAVATVEVTPTSANVLVGATQQLTALLKDANGNALTGRTVTWSSSNNAVATVDANGLVTGVAAGGPVTITATSESKAGTSSITVSPVPVATLTLSTPTTPMIVGGTQVLTATPKDGSNNALSGRTVNWVSSNPQVLSVSSPSSVSSSSGAAITVTAAAVGTAIITATSESAPSVSTPVITANAIPVATVTVSPPSASLVLGITPTQQLAATVKDANNNVLAGRTVTWSSSVPSVATVDANGFVTAVGAGTTTITATSETKTGTSSITVTVAPVNTVTVTPATASLVVGGTQQLVAQLKDAKGNVLTGRTVTWSSSNNAVATVDATGLVTGVAAGGPVTITATSETKTGTSSITVSLIPVASVTVTPPSASLVLGITPTQQLTAVTKDANGNVLTGRTVTWSSSNNAVATVDANGVATAQSVGGPVTITATSETRTGTSSVTVALAPVNTVTVTPPTATVLVGGTQQLAAQLKDANGNVLTGRTITWSSSNNAVATVDATGLVTGVAADGPVTITATSETKTGTSSITVALAPVATVTVTPPSASLILGVTPTQQLTAVTKDANGNVLTGRTVTWSSSNSAVATVDANGLVTAQSAGGPVTITATSETKTGTSSITVALAPVATVTVTPPTASVVVGGTQQLVAQLKDSNGNVLTGRTVTWSSSNNAVATVDATGLVTGVAAGGPVTITATSETKTGSSSITVTLTPVATVTVTPPSASVVVGGTQQLTAVTKDANGNVLTGRTVTWSSSNSAVATVDANGLVTAQSAGGPVTITATSETKTGTSSIAVTLAPVNTVTVTPPTATVLVGGTQQLAAQLKDANGNVLTGRTVTWNSSNNAVATVDANGLVTGVAAGGPVTITATSETKTGSSAITVNLVPIATVTVTPPSASLVLGVTPTQQLTVVTKDANGNVLTGRTVTWSSSNNAVATVDANGLVTAQSAGGPVTITATSETKTGISSITVTLAPVNTVAVAPTTASLVVGATQQLTATLTDVNGNVLTGRTITWASSNNAVATVDANGLVTGVTAGGPVNITATSETKTGTSSITVHLMPVATVTLSAPTTPMIVGGTQVLTATPKDGSNNTLAGRTVNWVSSNTAVLSVSASSSVSSSTGATMTVTAVGQGTATITATSETAPSATTPVITVNPIPVATVTVTPPSASLVLGVTPTQQLTAVTKDANGNVLTGRTVTWSSSNSAVATVDANGLVTGVAAGGPVTITATSETKTGTSSITVALAPVATVTVTPPSASVVVGGTQQLTAVTKDANGNVLTGRTITWSSSNNAVATVDATGLVTGVAAGGPVTITATSETKTGTSAITVNLVPVATVTVNPPSASLVLGVTPTQQLTAVTKDANGNVLTGRAVTWSSSNSAVTTVDANGLVTAQSAGGPVTITATSETKTGISSITVTLAPVNAVAVSPSSATLVLGMTPTQQLAATLTDVNGNVLTGRTVTWNSNNTAVATVSTTGLVTAVAAGGPVTITATSETKTGTSSVTVALAPVNTVAVTPPTATVLVGGTQQLAAQLKDANGNVLTGRTITWSSSNNAVATVDATGLVTGVAAGGPVTITATSETKTGTSAITVNLVPVATVTLSAPTTPMLVGGTQVLTAVTKDSNGNVLTGRTVSWVSSNTSVLSVSPASSTNGTTTVTAAGTGAATINATSESAPSATTPVITVNPIPVATVTVTPPSATLVLGVTPTQQLTAVTKDANGNVLTGRAVTWSSSNSAVATVDANGLVTAQGAGGPVTITATSESKTGTSSITVTLAPVVTVTLSAPTTPMVVGGAQVLTATLKDANNNTLTGRTVNWVSSNTAVLTVNPASSTNGTTTVTGVGVGTATITATSESVSSAPTPGITVTLAPVNSVTVSPLSASVSVGVKQQLTATLRDANNNILTGRAVTWSSSNPAVAPVDGNGVVTGIAVGGPVTITATSETKTGTSSITVTQAVINGPLQVSTVNPRYFADPSGRIVYLTGSHYWKNVQDDGTTNPPPAFDNVAYLDFLQQHNHNFTRLWLWEEARWTAETDLSHWFAPTMYVRVGPDTALDGDPKFDLNQINPAYLSRLRQRVIDAKARGIYVSVMLFDGWSIGFKGNSTAANPWLAHPFNAANNINSIDGDPNATGFGFDIQKLSIPAITALQDTYVKAVIDAVNDLDNVIYEISNESDPSADAWQYHMINLIHSYEATKPKQHPVGMTVPYPNATNSEVLSSPAEWVSMNGDNGGIDNLALADGTKVSLSDTDHLCGICGDAWWPWRSLMRGHNTLLMDGYDGSPGVGDPNYNPSDPIWEIIRTFMGYARSYSLRMDMANARPHPELSSSGDCLAVVGREYLVLLPTGGSVTVDLTGVSGTRSVEWFQPRTNQTVVGESVTGGGSVTLTAPASFITGSIAVLYIHP